ncbi:MAG TPA: hypothetical protein VHV10_14660 [Ktedonobacteraceae bacterium]|nr:hypothetical protein [Ktedonobacteraceae bacterium]
MWTKRANSAAAGSTAPTKLLPFAVPEAKRAAVDHPPVSTNARQDAPVNSTQVAFIRLPQLLHYGTERSLIANGTPILERFSVIGLRAHRISHHHGLIGLLM